MGLPVLHGMRYIPKGANMLEDRLLLIPRLPTVKYLLRLDGYVFNTYGSFNILYPRQATIEGEADQ